MGLRGPREVTLFDKTKMSPLEHKLWTCLCLLCSCKILCPRRAPGTGQRLNNHLLKKWKAHPPSPCFCNIPGREAFQLGWKFSKDEKLGFHNKSQRKPQTHTHTTLQTPLWFSPPTPKAQDSLLQAVSTSRDTPWPLCWPTQPASLVAPLLLQRCLFCIRGAHGTWPYHHWAACWDMQGSTVCPRGKMVQTRLEGCKCCPSAALAF